MPLRMTDEEKKLARRLRRMGLKARTARTWISHAEKTDAGTECVFQPHQRGDRVNKPAIVVLQKIMEASHAKR